MAAFPDLFEALSNRNLPDEELKATDVFPKETADARLREILDWVARVDRSQMILVPCGTESLSSASIALLTQRVDEFLASSGAAAASSTVDSTVTANAASKKVSRVLDAEQLFLPLSNEYVSIMAASRSPDLPQIALGDRVRYLRNGGPVAFGATGTVVASSPTGLAIVFDTQFISGTTLNGRYESNKPHATHLALKYLVLSTDCRLRPCAIVHF
jgi:hypothetical protein